MKKFLFKLIVFSIVPIVFVLVFDVFLRNMNTLSSAKYDGLMKKKNTIEVIFLGNSHANYAINPFYIKNFNTYNLANVSQKIYFDKRLLTKAINDGVSNLKYVFISVDYHSLFSSSQGIRNVWTYYSNGIKYKDQDYTKATISPFIWGYTPKIAISLFRKAFLRKIKYPNSIINFYVEDGVNINDTLYNGFLGYSGQKTTDFNDTTYELRAKTYKESAVKSERKEVIKDLKSFIIYLKKNNIEPILFSSPTFNEYNEYLNPKIIEQNKKDSNAICEEFNIQYWRFNEDTRFLKEDFYNPDHLNKKGAAKLSAFLNSKLLNYEQEKRYFNIGE